MFWPLSVKLSMAQMNKKFYCEVVKTLSSQRDAVLVSRLLKTNAQMEKSL